jgi:ABC-type antimicrobial peptide transport system permease subunit
MILVSIRAWAASSFKPAIQVSNCGVPPWALVSALGVTAVAGVVFGLYTANKAARLDPIGSLRYE